MTDHPIIFSAPMIRALLEGRKTMTRRLAHRWNKDNTLRLASVWQATKTGDRLWVRESLASHGHFGFPLGECRQTNPRQGRIWSHMADGVEDRTGGRPSIHMPCWASRLTLEVTASKIEPLQNISEIDAKAEGVDQQFRIAVKVGGKGHDCRIPNSFRGGFCNIWCELHGPESWDANPEVVALTFTVHQQNIDTMKVAA